MVRNLIALLTDHVQVRLLEPRPHFIEQDAHFPGIRAVGLAARGKRLARG